MQTFKHGTPRSPISWRLHWYLHLFSPTIVYNYMDQCALLSKCPSYISIVIKLQTHLFCSLLIPLCYFPALYWRRILSVPILFFSSAYPPPPLCLYVANQLRNIIPSPLANLFRIPSTTGLHVFPKDLIIISFSGMIYVTTYHINVGNLTFSLYFAFGLAPPPHKYFRDLKPGERFLPKYFTKFR